MPLSQEQRAAVEAALKNNKSNLRHLVLGPDGRTPMITDMIGFLDWATDLGDDRISLQIAFDEVGDTSVSTIFLSQIVFPNSDIGKRPFETLVSGDEYGEAVTKYETWDEAEAGHSEIVRELKAALPAVSKP